MESIVSSSCDAQAYRRLFSLSWSAVGCMLVSFPGRGYRLPDYHIHGRALINLTKAEVKAALPQLQPKLA